MRTMIRSDSTLVPPVTALRSPPLSRMTGADSPVIADSSTEAMPSMISPSPGIISPASATTRSPLRRLTRQPSPACVLPAAASCAGGAPASPVRIRRSVSACALPRPSATASAKLAKITVNQSQSAIVKVNHTRHRLGGRVQPIAQPEHRWSGRCRPRPRTSPDSWRRRADSSFFRLSQDRRRAGSSGSNRESRFDLAAMSEHLSVSGEQCFDDRPERERGEERQRADDDDDGDEQDGEQRAGGWEGAQALGRPTFLPTIEPRDRPARA